MKTITIATRKKDELIDITAEVQTILREETIESGACIIFTPHTTAAITINENADPDVQRDILTGLAHLDFESVPFRHGEGNSPSHLKSSIIGASETVIIEEGALQLGTWQGIYFCEFDGPRRRKVWLTFLH